MAKITIKAVKVEYPTTTVLWSDNTTTSVTCTGDDPFSVAHGVLWCVAKKFLDVGTVNKTIETGRKISGEY
jgi:hypothetical protein